MIVLILGAIAVVAVVTILIMSRFKAQRTNQLYTSASYQAGAIIGHISALVQSNRAWKNTLAGSRNTATFSCINASSSCAAFTASDPVTLKFPLTAPSGNFAIYDEYTTATPFYDSTVATSGFDKTGAVCAATNSSNSFDGVNGNDQCPFHVVLYWTTLCSSGVSCTYTIHGYVIYKPRARVGTQAASDSTSGLAPINYSLGFSLSNTTGAKTVAGIPKIGNSTQYSCCSIPCIHNSADAGLANVTISVLLASNCYAGSPEVPNDICDRAIFSSNSGMSSWSVSGVAPTTTAGTCPQGAP